MRGKLWLQGCMATNIFCLGWQVGHKLPNRFVGVVTTFVVVTKASSLTPQPKCEESSPCSVHRVGVICGNVKQDIFIVCILTVHMKTFVFHFIFQSYN